MALTSNYENLGYLFYVIFTTQNFSVGDVFFKDYGKRFFINFPYFQVFLIRDWQPIAKQKSSYQIHKERQEIFLKAQKKLAEKDIDWNNWDEIPF